MLLLALLTQAEASETWPAGQTLDDAASIHVTSEGFVAVESLVPAIVPSEPFVVEDVYVEGGEYDLSCLLGYWYSIENLWIGTSVTAVDIVPSNGVLEVLVELDVWVNDSGDQFTFAVEGLCAETSCPGWIDPFPVDVTIPLSLAITTGDDGKPRLDSSVGTIDVQHLLVEGDIHLDCWVQDMEDVLNAVGLSVYDILIDTATTELVAQIDDQKDEIEAAIDDALAAAYLNEDFDVAGTTLHVELYPNEVAVTSDGLVLDMQALASAEASSCVAAYDTGASAYSLSLPPAITTDPSDAHVGMLLSDDFANQALYAVWRGGVLCYELSGEAGGFSIDTALLPIIHQSYSELFPEQAPMVIVTDPRSPPVARWDGEHDITAEVSDLGLEFFAELDHRPVHVLGLSVDAAAGVDVEFDGEIGEVAVVVDISGDDLVASVSSNEFIPGEDETIVAAVSGLVETLLPTVLGPMLEDLAFLIPSQGGIGLSELDLDAAGAEADWLGAWAQVGEVPYDNADTDTDSASSGCSGCNAGARGAAAGLAFVVAGIAAGRRRR